MAKKDTATNSSNERMNDAVNKLNNNKNVIENSKPTTYQTKKGTAEISASGKVLTHFKDGQPVSHVTDKVEINKFKSMQDHLAKQKKIQDLARDVQEINPTKDQLANKSNQTRTEESMERQVVANKK